eukprot:scaffold22337_cov112-Isochrysis_galbana.AAC.6
MSSQLVRPARRSVHHVDVRQWLERQAELPEQGEPVRIQGLGVHQEVIQAGGPADAVDVGGLRHVRSVRSHVPQKSPEGDEAGGGIRGL